MRCALLLTACFAMPAWALDSTEPFDLGFSDYEMYVGGAGLGGDEPVELAWTSVIGVGITARFSASLAYIAAADETLGNSAEGLVAGLFATVVDTETFDFDLYGSTSTQAGMALGTELNLDFEGFGLQLTVEEALSDDPESDDLLRQTVLAPLARFSASEAVELLVAMDFTTASNHPDAPAVDVGATAFGVNIVLSDAVELITEAHVHLPGDGESLGFGAQIGFVATVPAAPAAP